MQEKIFIERMQNGLKLFAAFKVSKENNPDASFQDVAQEATQRLREEARIQSEKDFKPIENLDAVIDAVKKLGLRK